MLSRVNNRDHTTLRLKHLDRLPVAFCAQFRMLISTYKALNSLGTGDLKDHICPYEPTWQLQSSGGGHLHLPSASGFCLVASADKTFLVVAPQQWHSFPWQFLSLCLKRAARSYLALPFLADLFFYCWLYVPPAFCGAAVFIFITNWFVKSSGK